MQSIEMLIVIVLINALVPTALSGRLGVIQNDGVCCLSTLKSGAKPELVTPHLA